MNKNIKIHYDSKVYLLFFLIFLFGVGFFTYNFVKNEDCTSVDFAMISLSKTTGDLIEFKSLGRNDSKWEWNFGDGSNNEYIPDVLHKFDSAGTYNVTLKVNNSCVVSKQIHIAQSVYRENIDHEQVPTIVFPNKIRAGELIEFECVSDFATKWEWRFGTDGVDAITKDAKHVFEEEGTYKISLVVNDNLQHVLIEKIQVLPKKGKRRKRRRRRDRVNEVLIGQIPDDPKENNEKEEEDDMIKLTRSEAKKMLESYALGQVDYVDIKPYLCSSDIRVVNTSGKNSSLRSLLNFIRGKQIDIIDVNLYKNTETGCVKRIHIDLKYKGKLFWRKY